MQPSTKLLIVITFLSLSYTTFGCDVCNIFEYANRRNTSYIGVFYRHRFFNGYKDLGQNNQYYLNPDPLKTSNARQEHIPDSEDATFYKNRRDFEMYQTIELRANYAYKTNWNFQLIVPYVHNQLYYKTVWPIGYPIQDSVININGLGDLTIASDYTYSKQTGTVRHLIKPGLGLKIPTGSYTYSSNGKVLGYDVQPGTGSTDILLRLNYLVTNDKWGVDLFLNYRFCTQGKNNVKLGNKWNVMSSLYYTIKIKEISCLPKIGSYFEYSSKDVVNSEVKDLTGGSTWFYQSGIDLMYKQIIIQFLFQKPFSENLNGPVIGNAGRLTFGILYNFD